MAYPRSSLLFLPFLLTAASFSSSLTPATTAGSAAKAACTADLGGTMCAPAEEGGEAKAIRALEEYTALLEEKLQQHEQQQREQQKSAFFVFLAIGLSIAVVFVVALTVCKVYIQSLHDQLRCVFQKQKRQQQQLDQDENGCYQADTPTYRKPGAAAADLRHRRVYEQQCLSSPSPVNSSSNKGAHHLAAYLEAVDETSDEEELRLWPSKEEVERAKAIEAAQATAKPSAEVQRQQQQLETRCASLFQRLHAITDASRAFCSSSANESEQEVAPDGGDAAAEAPKDAGTGDTAAAQATTGKGKKTGKDKKHREIDSARMEEQQQILQQLQQLFLDIDSTFKGNKPAHVSVMIRCCNALLKEDGLAVLKACADCQPLHSAAQCIIETVVPCIWAT